MTIAPIAPFRGDLLASGGESAVMVRERLSSDQEACLRLVSAGLSSREIAEALGFTPAMVDRRLRAATKILGVSGRQDAARLLRIAEDAQGAGDVAASTVSTGAPALRLAPASLDQWTILDETEREHGNNLGYVADAGHAVAGTQQGRLDAHRWVLWSADWREPNTRAVVVRLTIMVLVLIGSALSFGALVSALQALDALRN